jgi:hypothetical protein
LRERELEREVGALHDVVQHAERKTRARGAEGRVAVGRRERGDERVGGRLLHARVAGAKGERQDLRRLRASVPALASCVEELGLQRARQRGGEREVRHGVGALAHGRGHLGRQQRGHDIVDIGHELVVRRVNGLPVTEAAGARRAQG